MTQGSDVFANGGRLRAVLLAATGLAAQRAWLVITAAILPFLVFWPTTASLLKLWNDPVRAELSHGLLTLGIVVYLLWFRRDAYAAPVANRWAFAVLAVCSVLWLVLFRAGVQIAHQLLLPIISAITVCAVCGWTVARRALFPLGYLYLAMPVWMVLNATLQWGSVLAVRTMLRLVGIPAHFAGTAIEISAGEFEIADGCSGLRLMLVGLAIALLYGELQRTSVRMRIRIVAIAVVLSALANWLRILIIIAAGHLYGIDHPLVGDHIWFGWLVFAAVMVVFFLIMNRLPMSQDDKRLQERPVAQADARITLRHWSAAMLASLTLLVAPVWALAQATMRDGKGPSDVADVSLAGWEKDRRYSDWQPRYVGADAEFRFAQRADDAEVELYIASYREQRQDKELIGYRNSVFGDQGARVLAQTVLEAGPDCIQYFARSRDQQSWVYWHSYRVGDKWLINPLSAQLQYAVTSLWEAPDSQVVILRMRCDNDDCARASQRLLPLWQQLAIQLSS